VLIAVPIGYFATLYMTWKAGHGDSREPEHVALQTRQDVGGVYSALFVTNALPKARTIPRSPVAASPRLPRASAWHVQLFTSLAVIAGIKELVLAALVPVALDHFGGAQVALGPAALRGSRRSRALRRGPCENFRRLRSSSRAPTIPMLPRSPRRSSPRTRNASSGAAIGRTPTPLRRAAGSPTPLLPSTTDAC